MRGRLRGIEDYPIGLWRGTWHQNREEGVTVSFFEVLFNSIS